MSSRSKRKHRGNQGGESTVEVLVTDSENEESESSFWNWKWALLAFAFGAIFILLSVWTSLPYGSWSGVNDYYFDAGPSIDAFINGNFSFWHVAGIQGGVPAMMPLTVVLRGLVLVPIVHIVHLSSNSRYIAGCVILIGIGTAFLSYGFDQILAVRDRLAMWGVVVAAGLLLAIYPLFGTALITGHPEEIFGAVLLFVAVVLLYKGREKPPTGRQWLWPALLVGLTMSIKQDFWVAAPALLLICPPRWRWRMVVTALLTTLVFTIPILVAGKTPLSNTTVPGGATRAAVWLLGGKYSNLTFANNYNRVFIFAIALALPLLVLLRDKRLSLKGGYKWSLSRALLLVGAVMLLRAFLDPAVNSYYNLGAFVCFLGAELCYIKDYRDAKLHNLQPYRVPLPWATLVWGVFIWQFTDYSLSYNLLIEIFHTNQNYIFPGLYALACLVPLLICARVLFWTRSERPVWSFRYWIALPTIVLLAGVCSLSAFGKSPKTVSTPTSFGPSGLYTNLPATASLAAREPIYWLGADTTVLAIPSPEHDPNILSWAAYRINNSFNVTHPIKPGAPAQVGVETEKTTTPTLPALISSCRTSSPSCPTNDHFIQTPIGSAVLSIDSNPTGWSLYVLAPQHKMVLVEGVNIPSSPTIISSITKLLSRVKPQLVK